MIGYASNTGTLRNLEALRSAGWRLLLTPDNPKPRRGLAYGIDNGAFGAFRKQMPFQDKPFAELVRVAGADADFVVLPDIVAGGDASLAFSKKWHPFLSHLKLCLLPVQDGMDPEAVGAFIRTNRRVGIFLGGSTEYKLKHIYAWGVAAAALGCYYHVGRVNTARRIRLCAEAGAQSFDGTSATMYATTLPLLDSARRQPSLLAPGTANENRPGPQANAGGKE